VRDNKFWPSVNRIDDVYGDRNLFCACVPMDEIWAEIKRPGGRDRPRAFLLNGHPPAVRA
jgi:hypothetical protein